ncbi:MAG: 2-C-methyl-D-erythritol 4-phosphate cytidylyltransferase [Clostridiaceae bacterium]|nr:2-C-methyl-D-erythritol 4-phosphate cytidylyltransferase [Clostridiaceae bacterium]
MSKFIRVSAIIAAAGKSTRMNTGMNKLYMAAAGKPVLAHTIDAFEKTAVVSEIIVVIGKEDEPVFNDCILGCYNFSKISAVVYGGNDRQASVYNGLQAVSDKSDVVCVHDGARPFVTPDIISNTVAVAYEKGAACTGVPVKDTIKKTGRNGIIEETLDRSLLWNIQTPQAFKREILEKAHKAAAGEGFRGTDDSVLVERLGYPVLMVMGSYKNIKITTPEDLIFAEAVFKTYNEAQK